MHTTASRRSWSLLLALTGLLLLSLVGAPSAHACSCMGYSFEEAIESADLIADVTVQHEIADLDGEITYYAAVDTMWKGEESRTIELTTHEQTTACGLGRIPDGTSLMVWASGEGGEYSTTWCALPMDGGPDDRERLTELLGEPADLTGRPIPPSEHGAPPAWGWIAAGVGVVAVLAALALRVAALVTVLVLHRRRRV